jgi:serine phosphatase RsbU (regulator of sigma subunit)
LDHQQLGALELYAKDPIDLSDADLAGAQILADVTAAYLFNARAREAARALTEATQELAATLQESLLPPELPDVPGLAVAARWLPGRGGTLVGGDFYDVFPLPSKRWGALIGDAVGHGARAATLAALARYTVRTLAVLQTSPRQVLAGLNDAVLRRGELEQFLTAIYLTTRATAHGVAVRLVSGGHPLPLLRHADGLVEAIEAPGVLLGCLPGVRLQEVRFTMAPGELLLLYSDDVTEARRGLAQFGEDRLGALLAGAEPIPSTIVDAVIDGVLAHCHDDLADDVTVLALAAT